MCHKQKIILVDDQLLNLTLGHQALADSYEIYAAPSGKALFKLLQRVRPQLILLDIEMPEMNGYQIIQQLKSDSATAGIPVIFLTARGDIGSELEGLSLGAVDYILKPFSPALLRKRIELHLLVEQQKEELYNYSNNLEAMVRSKTNTILELQTTVLKTVAELVECRDFTTGGHIDRTQRYFRILIEGLLESGIYQEETSTWDKDLLILSSQLHDVGKIAINDSILQKPGRLNTEEFAEMKKHTILGAQVIEKIQSGIAEQAFLSYAKTLALTHHERWDGSGYPYGLQGGAVPLAGRLLAIADVYDALRSTRQYKGPLCHEDSVKIIMEGQGSHFEPQLTEVFYQVAPQFAQIETKE